MDRSLPRKIWLAGLGAIARAEHDGEAWLDELMAEGQRYEEEQQAELNKALSQLTHAAQKAEQRAHSRFGNIESAFETKVSQTLGKIGIITRDQLDSLEQKLTEIEQQIEQAADQQK